MDLNRSSEPAAESPEPVQSEAATETPKLDSVEKAYFPSSKIEAAQDAIEKASGIAEANGVNVTYNFDINEDFPDGYGIAIDHIAKRGANGNEIVGILVAAIPDYETIAEHENGMAFIKEKVSDFCLAKLKNAVRPRGEDNAISASVPFTVSDFITSARPEGVLVAFRSLAPAYVKMLKKKGISTMTEAILRQTLQSRAFAEQNFPKVDQAKWEMIIDSMIANAKAEGKATGILDEWKATRDSAELQTADVDLSDLDFDDMSDDSEQETAAA